MKFKYNFLAKKLWRMEDDYLYEIGEGNRHIEHIPYIGIKLSFELGAKHYLLLSSDDELVTKMTVCYTKPLKNGELVHYEKKIKRQFFGLIETIFEFTEEDRTPLKEHQE